MKKIVLSLFLSVLTLTIWGANPRVYGEVTENVEIQEKTEHVGFEVIPISEEG